MVPWWLLIVAFLIGVVVMFFVAANNKKKVALAQQQIEAKEEQLEKWAKDKGIPLAVLRQKGLKNVCP
jgi:hypothetical protein